MANIGTKMVRAKAAFSPFASSINYRYKKNSIAVHDKDLIIGCIKKDRECQRKLYAKYAGKMMTVCLRYARHYAEAEDILQDGFIKVFKNISKFKHQGSFEGWVRRIMINTALSNFKKSSYQKEYIGTENYQEGAYDPRAISNLSEEEIMNEIAQLPDGYKVVFNMYVVDGFSHREVAEKLNITESTSRSQLVKARRMLQKKLHELQKINI